MTRPQSARSVTLTSHCTLLSCSCSPPFFFFNDTATTEIYTLSLHDALPICSRPVQRHRRGWLPRGRRAAPEGRVRSPNRERCLPAERLPLSPLRKPQILLGRRSCRRSR